MRWLSLLIASVGIALPAVAFALPQPDAEAAYARGDYATAFKIWLPLAEQGSPEAQRNVARMYERGEWVAQDKQAAMEWYQRAAEQSARDAAMPGAANAPATAASVGAGVVPGATTSGMPPSSTTYPRPTSYPGSPSPVVFPTARPVFVPGFRLHRHRH
jgi:hypothetical protein